MKLTERVDLWFLLLIIFIYLITFQVDNVAIDMPVHDTYYVIYIKDLIDIILLFLIIVYLSYLYFYLKKILFSKILSLFQFIFNTIPLIYFGFMMYASIGQNRRYHSVSAMNHDKILVDFLMMVLFLTGVIIFIINVFYALSGPKLKSQ